MGGIIDFHSHVLPGMDDGSRSASESLAMLRLMKSQGFHTVVATPHFYANHDFPEDFLRRREGAVRQLQRELLFCSSGVPGGGSESDGWPEDLPNLVLGAEVAYFRGMSQSKVLQDLVIEGTRAILVEMPMGRWTDSMYEELELIHLRQGLIPIVAHVDRYLGRFRDYGIPQVLAELPVLVQANASFFLEASGSAGGLSGGSVRKAMKMLMRDQIHLLGSDAHNMNERGPRLNLAVASIEHGLGPEGGEKALARIEAWQEKILPGIKG